MQKKYEEEQAAALAEKEKEDKAKNTTGAKMKQTTENLKSKTMNIFKKKAKDEEEADQAPQDQPKNS